MCPDFIKAARAEGQKTALESFNFAKTAEAEHANLYTFALQTIGTSTGKAPVTYYVCTVCGFTTSKLDVTKCPACFSPKEKYIKVAHRGDIWGVYVKPKARGHGVARALITELIAVARSQVKQVHLSVVTENAPAVRLYKDLGFTIYGTEPRSLCVDGRYLDEHMMVLRFD